MLCPEKKNLEEYHLAHLLFSLTEVKNEGLSKKSAEEFFRKKFLSNLKKDPAFSGVTLEKELEDKYFLAKVEENEKTLRLLPTCVREKLNWENLLKFECCEREDKRILTPLAEQLLNKTDEIIARAKRESEEVMKKLRMDLDLDFFIGEIVTSIEKKEDRFIVWFENVSLVVDNYEVEKEDNFKVVKWNEEDPFSPYTMLRFARVIAEVGGIKLQLLFTSGDEFERLTHHEIIIKGKRVYKK